MFPPDECMSAPEGVDENVVELVELVDVTSPYRPILYTTPDIYPLHTQQLLAFIPPRNNPHLEVVD